MRKTIFKKELLFVFHANKIEKLDQEKIESALFSNYPSGGPYYILKESILNLSCLEKVLNEIKLKQKDSLFRDLSDLFLVSDDLNILPSIKQLFKENDKVALFIGAGVSKLCGVPLWDELSDGAIRYLYENSKLINNFEYSTIKRSFQNPKKKLSIFHNFLDKDSQDSMAFYKTILDPKKLPQINPYDLLVEFQCPIFTSNIDSLLIDAFERSLKSLPKNGLKEVPPDKYGKTSISPIYNGFHEKIQIKSGIPYYIHGNFNSNPNSTILTIEDYLHSYKVGSGLRKFLEYLFQNYRVIFIGYGLEEFEILEYLFDDKSKDRIHRHYALLPVFLSEINLLSVNKHYLERFNIEVLPYYLDFNGYDRLLNLLSKWLDSLKDIRTESYYENVSFLESGGL